MELIQSSSLFPLNENCYIVEGTPFLYIKDIKTLVLGDLHLGQEVGIMGFDPETGIVVSKSTIELKSQLIITINELDIEVIVFNGDIKHSTNKINKQERIELKYIYEEPILKKIKSIIVKGNHDKLLKLLLKTIDANISVYEIEYKFKNYLFTHGHLMPEKEFDVLILSHEHPSFILRGSIHERVKLPAFVSMKSLDDKEIIILPAANGISGGVVFPPTDKSKFLGPYLSANSDFASMKIFPFDYTTGVLPLPPIEMWNIDFNN